MQEAALLITFTEENLNGKFIFCAVFWGNKDHLKRCSVKKLFLKFRKTHRETPVSESLSF